MLKFYQKTFKKRKTRGQDQVLVQRRLVLSTKKKTSRLESWRNQPRPRSTVLRRSRNRLCFPG